MEVNKSTTTNDSPPKTRDLSARYGQNANTQRHPDDIIPAINLKHPVFLAIASLGFAALYAELLFFAATYYGNSLGLVTNVALIAGVFVLSAGVIYASFVLPHRFYRPRFTQYSPIIFLITQYTLSIIMLLALTGAVLAAGVFLVGGELGAVGELLRSLALYTIVAIAIFHGIVIYVRYVRYLYEREMHESYKIVSFAGVLAVIVLVVTLYLLQFDLGRMGGGGSNGGWLALHLSIRDIALIGLLLFVFIWHGSVLADH